MGNTLQENAHIIGNSLYINVENLTELQEIIQDIKIKEKALHDAVHKLETFNLEISFTNK